METKKLLLKVCGLRQSENIEQADSLGIDFTGYIFYPPSKRYAGKPEQLPRTKSKKVGVFVNELQRNVLETVQRYQFDAVQLHGDESPDYCAVMMEMGITVIKSFGISDAGDLNQTKNYEGVCDYFLFDTKVPEYGGSGKKFSWQTLDSYSGSTPFLLSGGIGPDDAEAIASIQHPMLAGIDLNSRFEQEPGLKNIELLKTFISKLK